MPPGRRPDAGVGCVVTPKLTLLRRRGQADLPPRLL
jgi:hypothetical protein